MRRKKRIGNERKPFPPPLIAELLNSLTTNWPERLKSTKHIPRVHVLSAGREAKINGGTVAPSVDIERHEM